VTGLELALQIIRRRARWRRETGRAQILALELDLVAAEVAEANALADTARFRTVRCPTCRTVVTLHRTQ
jgi:hypothetical protein